MSPGPWYPARHTGASGASYFVVKRNNARFAWGGIEIMTTKGFMNRRFKTLKAAQAAADAANKPSTEG